MREPIEVRDGEGLTFKTIIPYFKLRQYYVSVERQRGAVVLLTFNQLVNAMMVRTYRYRHEGAICMSSQLRIGHGYDVHRLVEGRRCIIGGVDIPHDKGLLGHSDADVLAHALADAILGAARAGDIGKLFPDTDPAYEGADSLVLLSRVMEYVRGLGFEFIDADCTIACQKPKISPHRDQMRANLSRALGVDIESVGVAATTTERLGWEGQGEGIGAWAVCLLEKKSEE